MRCADLRRAKVSRFHAEAHCAKVGVDNVEPLTDVSGHVLEKSKSWLHLTDDAFDVGPKMSRVRIAATLSRNAEGLARVSCSDDIHDATPWLTVEGGNIRPDRRVT